MKLTGARLDRFLAAPDPDVACVLVYGPDQGLVRERADALARHVVADAADPFRVVELTGAAIKADPARLADEAMALSMVGGRRVVRLREAADAIAPVLGDLLGGPTPEALVVVEAGDLSPRSSLRKLFEGADAGAAIACYADDAGSLRKVISETLGAHGLVPTRDALDFLAGHLGSDRGVTRGELEKLALYKGPVEGGGGQVTLDDVLASVGDSGAVSVEALVYAAADGDLAALDQALERVLAEGIHGVAVVRAAQRHFQRLHQAAALVAAGRSPAEAVKSLRPPLIFKVVNRFQAQLRLWDKVKLGQAFDLMVRAEADMKSTGMPEHLICGRMLMGLASAARRRSPSG
ncbi:MAG: DNA polymerase III subunit delta [Hyphomicrobiales bacterium]|nr:DNA polymerase III subunit delta [Hyphomicrobiales bacterium]MCP5370472.1 DNA polymerase III subunit delta [Hyphomicrobiales bacterium]